MIDITSERALQWSRIELDVLAALLEHDHSFDEIVVVFNLASAFKAVGVDHVDEFLCKEVSLHQCCQSMGWCL
jgi:hypothetical protein